MLVLNRPYGITFCVAIMLVSSFGCMTEHIAPRHAVEVDNLAIAWSGVDESNLFTFYIVLSDNLNGVGAVAYGNNPPNAYTISNWNFDFTNAMVNFVMKPIKEDQEEYLFTGFFSGRYITGSIHGQHQGQSCWNRDVFLIPYLDYQARLNIMTGLVQRAEGLADVSPHKVTIKAGEQVSTFNKQD